MEKFFFLIFASIAVGSGLLVISLRNPVHSALSLIVCFFQVACIFVLLRAPFLAAAQVFIYVGAVMVLFLFVVMVLDMKKAVMEAFPSSNRWFVYALPSLITIEVFLFVILDGFEGMEAKTILEETKVGALGKLLYTKYLFPFEAVSVLLLAAMVGAIVLVKRKWR